MLAVVAPIANRPMVGIPLGVLIGVVSGVVFVTLMTAAEQAVNDRSASSILKVVAELLAIPTFWFGGPWVTAAALRSVDLNTILDPYAATLAITFVTLLLYPLLRYVIRLGNRIGGVDHA